MSVRNCFLFVCRFVRIYFSNLKKCEIVIVVLYVLHELRQNDLCTVKICMYVVENKKCCICV